jgi:hypothetical protein
MWRPGRRRPQWRSCPHAAEREPHSGVAPIAAPDARTSRAATWNCLDNLGSRIPRTARDRSISTRARRRFCATGAHRPRFFGCPGTTERHDPDFVSGCRATTLDALRPRWRCPWQPRPPHLFPAKARRARPSAVRQAGACRLRAEPLPVEQVIPETAFFGERRPRVEHRSRGTRGRAGEYLVAFEAAVQRCPRAVRRRFAGLSSFARHQPPVHDFEAADERSTGASRWASCRSRNEDAYRQFIGQGSGGEPLKSNRPMAASKRGR